jgi:uncharacterized protein
VPNNLSNYVTPPQLKIHASPLEIDAQQWNALLAQSDAPTPFMRHEYLAAMHTSGSATAQTGWQSAFVGLYGADGQELLAACPLYLKTHSYGEYVFDWAWARAYQEHGLAYYPKAVVAVPFTPVPGSRFLYKKNSENDSLPAYLLDSLLLFYEQNDCSSLHVLFTSSADMSVDMSVDLGAEKATAGGRFMQRQTVQFHWTNRQSTPYADFDDYLATLTQDKRKKIRAERRKVADAGVSWRTVQGSAISTAQWDFFYRCYERTYLEHGNAPYLSREFFASMQAHMPENWLLFVATRAGQDIACSLIAIQDTTKFIANYLIITPAYSQTEPKLGEKVAYGRYWGALERVDSLHFDACYYQPLAWCIAQGYGRFEGGAQGEHKMARGLLPVVTHSLHHLAQPQFADAVERFLQREGAGIADYVEHLKERSPFSEKSEKV